jgi:peptide/nickel transport system ATP-binding protein
MYAGRMVEHASAIDLFEEMRHPYTEALLRSIPRIEDASHTQLEAISGRPPDMVAPPAGCRFGPRCRYAQQTCVDVDPELRAGGATGHVFACHFGVATPEGREALTANETAGVTATGLDLNPQVVG